MRLYNRIHWLTIVLLALLISTGCSLFGGKEALQPAIEPPEDIAVESMDKSVWEEIIQTAAAGPSISLSMYFKDPNGYVVPVKMSFPDTESPAKEMLHYMTQGGPGEAQLPAGFTGLLPQGTEVLGMDINKGLATVDFSKQFLEYDPADERRILEAVTWALTGFPTIDQVVIRVEGRSLTEMPANGTPLDVPLTRSMGINLESLGTARPTASMPVTVYYLNRTSSQQPYYVPVTRLVERSDNKTMALLEQLIKGPSAMTGLMPVIDEHVEVLSLEEKEGLVTINFSKEFTGTNDAAPMEAVQTVVLSLTDHLPADTQVQILVEGKSYDQPVTRPVHVNEISM